MNLRNFVGAVFIATSLLFTTSCTTVDPGTGERVYDPIKTDQVKAALAPFVTTGIRAVIANNPRHRDELGTYFRGVGTVFCRMHETGQFSADYIYEEIGKLVAPKIAEADPLLLAAKDAAVSLFLIFYADRFRAELPPDAWPAHVSELVCQSIDTALKDSGLPGVR